MGIKKHLRKSKKINSMNERESKEVKGIHILIIKICWHPNSSETILARGGWVGLTVIIRPVSVPNWTGTELANLN